MTFYVFQIIFDCGFVLLPILAKTHQWQLLKFCRALMDQPAYQALILKLCKFSVFVAFAFLIPSD